MNEIKLAIVGYRNFTNYDNLKTVVDLWVQKYGIPNCIISGGCKGADTLAERYANENNIKMTIFYPDRQQFPKGNIAFWERDKLIAEKSHIY